MTCINNFQFPPLLHDFYFFLKSKIAVNMAASFDDVTGPQQRPHP